MKRIFLILGLACISSISYADGVFNLDDNEGLGFTFGYGVVKAYDLQISPETTLYKEIVPSYALGVTAAGLYFNAMFTDPNFRYKDREQNLTLRSFNAYHGGFQVPVTRWLKIIPLLGGVTYEIDKQKYKSQFDFGGIVRLSVGGKCFRILVQVQATYCTYNAQAGIGFIF